MLTKEERSLALQIARNSIKCNLSNDFDLEVELEKVSSNLPENSPLRDSFGCFVTLHINGQLRGCIGTIESNEPLYENIVRNAKSSAFYDPRFIPLTMDEFNNIDIEISVMGKVTPVEDLDLIQVGTHGLIATNGLQRGLLLPQVPVEQKWKRQEFIEYTCMKAGLPRDAWKESTTKFYSFTAEVFGELEMRKLP